jgi:Fe-S oxidoreductase
MRALPLLEPHRAELETCVFCPKLCRSACPVSSAEPRETVTPWGKMSLAWMAAHGDVPADGSHAAPAWACTGCFACREACDHRNPVADVLLDARDALVRAGAAPAASTRILSRFERHDARTREKTRRLAAAHAGTSAAARDALLVGCTYVRGAPREARDAVDAAAALLGRPMAVVEGCCGLPLRLAGDREAFARHARGFARALEGKDTLTIADAGCAFALARRYPEAGVRIWPTVETLVELAARRVATFSPSRVDGASARVLWHDPCQLGRGLGVYEAPRSVLHRVLGRAPDEFAGAREHAACSGAGGLLPATMPETAAAIARARVADADGATIVTGCASSLLALRRAAGDELAVEDIASVVARALSRGVIDVSATRVGTPRRGPPTAPRG